MLSQTQNAPAPGMINWCEGCGTLSVGKAEAHPSRMNDTCDHNGLWKPVAPFNGVHGNSGPITPKQPTIERQSSPDAPTCTICHTLTVRLGACYFCYNCNTSSGGCS